MHDRNEPLLSVTLPVELTNGNEGRSKHFGASKKRRDEYEALFRLICPRDPFEFPVAVTVTRNLGRGQRLWDSSSGLRGNWKEIEDALVAAGWFRDDSPKWIKETIFRQNTGNRGCGGNVTVTIRRKTEAEYIAELEAIVPDAKSEIAKLRRSNAYLAGMVEGVRIQAPDLLSAEAIERAKTEYGVEI